MADVVHRISELTHTRLSWFGCSDDDACNRLNHRHTVLMLLIFSAILTSRLFISDLIICWTPGEFTGNFVSYTRHYCYVTNTYYFSMNETLPSLEHSHLRRKRSIYYYQWLPILLAFQSFLFLIPRFIWSNFSCRCGINLQHCLSPQYDYRTSRYKVHHITTMLNLLARTNQLSSRSFHNNPLANLFLLVKILFLINSTLQLICLNALLTKNSTLYGFEVLDNFRRGEYVVGTRIFPLNVFCDFNIMKIGQPTIYTVQCLLPMNVFNEKIFTIIWFWLVFLTLTNLKSVLWTIIQNLFRQGNYAYVANYLGLYSKRERLKRNIRLKRFISHYLSVDSILILRLISENISDLLTSEVINELWSEYRKMSGGGGGNHREKSSRIYSSTNDNQGDK